MHVLLQRECVVAQCITEPHLTDFFFCFLLIFLLFLTPSSQFFFVVKPNRNIKQTKTLWLSLWAGSSGLQFTHKTFDTRKVLMMKISVWHTSYLLGLLAKIKCSICSYQLNLWYGGHCPPSRLNLFLHRVGDHTIYRAPAQVTSVLHTPAECRW